MKISERNRRIGKVTKRLAITACILSFIPCLAIVAFCVLDIANIWTFETLETNTYLIQFLDYNSRIIYERYYDRGEKIDTSSVKVPYRFGDEYVRYEFIGWDYIGNERPDRLPKRAYFSFACQAAYKEIELKKRPSSSDSSEETMKQYVSPWGDHYE